MNIISYKRLHFRKFVYTNEKKLQENGVTTNQIVANIEDEIIVPGDGLPKTVPDWVKEDDLFQLACADGSCSQITVVPQKIKPLNNNPKVKFVGVREAQDAKPDLTDESGAPLKNQQELVPVGTAASKDWPKREKSQDGLIASNQWLMI